MIVTGPVSLRPHIVRGLLLLIGVPALFSQSPPNYRAVLNQYCVTCHNEKTKTGGLTLDNIDLSNIPANADTWEKVIRKVRVGMMPPQGLPRPDEATRNSLVSWLQSTLDRAAAANPNPGRPLVHRLNRTEYANAIRDLLALDVDSASLLPPDDSGYGFDNIADVLGVSPVLLERYLSAAGKISALAVGDPGVGPAGETFRVRQDASQDVHIEGLPIGTVGGLLAKTTLPLDGEYVLQPTLFRTNLGAMRGLEYPNQLEITVDGERVHLAPFGGDADFKASLENITAAADAVEARFTARLHLKAGPHEIGVAFLKRSSTQNTLRLQSFIRSSNDTLDPAGHPHLLTFTVTGPFNPAGPGDTPSRRQIFTCRPANPAEELPCARKILATLSNRAYRGMSTPADLQRLMEFYESGRAAVPPSGPSTPAVPLSRASTPAVPPSGPSTPAVPPSGPGTPAVPLSRASTPAVPPSGPSAPAVPLSRPSTPAAPPSGPSAPAVPLSRASTPAVPTSPATTPAVAPSSPSTPAVPLSRASTPAVPRASTPAVLLNRDSNGAATKSSPANPAFAAAAFDQGIEMALERILASPKFVFRTERDPAHATPGSIYPVTELELASRLSFFLWSTIPDDELLQLAAQNKLRSHLNEQVHRMLSDPKAEALVTNFAGQWLYLRNLRTMVPNSVDFPDFDDNLRQSFLRETELFFGSVMREDRNVLDLMTADYTFVNERLARHYKIPNIYGSQFRRIAIDNIDNGARKGLLGQGSILMVTSHTDRTSPVVRGKWILDNLLGAPPPPMPANVPPLNENPSGKVLTMRERMEEHRANPVCAGCHQIMDPIGFSLENFDAVGSWRTREGGTLGNPIDASGQLLDGTKVNGPVELREALLKHPEIFVDTLTEKLMTYALGRGLQSYDMPVVRQIVRTSKDYRFTALVLGIINSTPFQMREVGPGLPPCRRSSDRRPQETGERPCS